MFDDLFPLLKENELPGPKLWNNLALLIRGLQSRSEPYFTINERPGGGIFFDLDIDEVREAAKTTLWLSLDEETATWALSAGSIRIAPSTVLSVADTSGQVATTTCIWIEWNASSATVQTGASFPNLVNMSNKKIRTPIGQINVNDGIMTLTHLHPGGDICVYDRPWILLDNYDNATRGYRITTTNGTESYATPTVCTQPSSESSEGV